MQKKLTLLVFMALTGLAACSNGSDLDRAIIGGLAGCAAGEIISDGKCITGAAIGATAGALADDI